MTYHPETLPQIGRAFFAQTLNNFWIALQLSFDEMGDTHSVKYMPSSL